jgi:hypothetical protein
VALTTKFVKLRQRFGIAAPRVSVRSEVAWYLRWLGLILVLAGSCWRSSLPQPAMLQPAERMLSAH